MIYQLSTKIDRLLYLYEISITQNYQIRYKSKCRKFYKGS